MAKTSFYKYLEAAFRFRVRHTDDKSITPNTRYSDLGYSLPYKKIFEYARKVLPPLYRSEGIFPNTEEGNLQLAKKVLEKLDKHQDTQLKKQFEEVSGTQETEAIIAQAQAESQQAEAQQAFAGKGQTSSPGNIGLPSAPTIFSPGVSRVIHNVPHTPEPSKPDIAIANKSGYVAEKPPSEFHIADKNGNITATYSKEPMSNIQTEAAKPKLVLARSDGSIIEPKTPVSKIAIADKGSIKEHAIPTQGRFNFSSFKSSASSAFKKAQNFAAPANPWLKTNLNRIAGGLKGVLGDVGRQLTGPGLTSVANFGGRAGLRAINHGGNFLNNLSNTRSRFSAASKSLSPKNMGSKRVLLVSGGIFLFVFFISALVGLPGTTSTGEAAPIASSSASLSTPLGCPVTGPISAPYGHNIKGYPENAPENEGCSGLKSCHSGIDIAPPAGTNVITPIDGTVIEVDPNNALRGPYVVIDNSQTQFKILISHLDDKTIAVKIGDTVTSGTVVGAVGNKGEGSTGYHVHYRLYKNNQIVNPFRYLGSSYNQGTSALIESDNITANNYNNGGETNLGYCQ